jgi:hypothetical protein
MSGGLGEGIIEKCVYVWRQGDLSHVGGETKMALTRRTISDPRDRSEAACWTGMHGVRKWAQYPMSPPSSLAYETELAVAIGSLRTELDESRGRAKSPGSRLFGGRIHGGQRRRVGGGGSEWVGGGAGMRTGVPPRSNRQVCPLHLRSNNHLHRRQQANKIM